MTVHRFFTVCCWPVVLFQEYFEHFSRKKIPTDELYYATRYTKIRETQTIKKLQVRKVVKVWVVKCFFFLSTSAAYVPVS